MMGTNSTPPPTPPKTATIPMTKVTTSSTNGHTHHAVVFAACGFVAMASAAQDKIGLETVATNAAVPSPASLEKS
jgi:hypothetical protein